MPQTVLTVFLSSTAKDLTAFRDAVHARLCANEHFRCMRNEDFGAHDAHAVDLCREQVTKADLFVGLIGLRRGWEPPNDPATRSITEMEYDWAKEISRPRFIYVSPDDFPVPGNLHEDTPLHQRQLGFRARVMAERVVSQNGFGSPDLLAAEIVERLLKHVMSIDAGEREQVKPPAQDASTLKLDELPDVIVNRLLAALGERGELQKAQTGGLERDTIIKLAKRLKPDDTLDFDRAMAELENAVAIALDAIARGARGSNQDVLVNDVLARVADQTKAGRFDQAAREVDGALAELDRREAEQREAMQRSRVALLEAGIEQDILRRDAEAVARRVEGLVAIEYPDDPAERFEALRRRYDSFHVEGRDKGINLSLDIAIAVSRRTHEIAQTPDQRGAALNDLGIVLGELGERESGTERLQQAADASRAASLEYTRERVPLDWAMTQNNLGNALRRLGERESGTERLQQAVEAYRSALLECTRDRVPLQWAGTQNNLGNALRRLGERESGTERLQQAVEAYRSALHEFTRDRVPLDWAMTQNNLGIALRRLGERESGTDRLQQAVEAYRAALLEYTRERVPLNWAGTQNNLGAALQTLGGRESGTERLQQAVEAYRSALLEYTRERVPLYWAATWGNQGVAMMQLADRRADARMAQAALRQIEQAYEVSRDGGHARNAAYFESQLPAARALVARLGEAGGQ